ncbi:hypothetical protein G4B88_012765 [Cannabis sativa]|uniref:Uncharacterized protein n=1 Tax=Cannabis sativa TaxID=3483 RepID=A0A7J6GAI6_CANSA|nr:hypothetical protein G4B88_012765 [Cannabis sativa]
MVGARLSDVLEMKLTRRLLFPTQESPINKILNDRSVDEREEVEDEEREIILPLLPIRTRWYDGDEDEHDSGDEDAHDSRFAFRAVPQLIWFTTTKFSSSSSFPHGAGLEKTFLCTVTTTISFIPNHSLCHLSLPPMIPPSLCVAAPVIGLLSPTLDSAPSTVAFLYGEEEKNQLSSWRVLSEMTNLLKLLLIIKLRMWLIITRLVMRVPFSHGSFLKCHDGGRSKSLHGSISVFHIPLFRTFTFTHSLRILNQQRFQAHQILSSFVSDGVKHSFTVTTYYDN